MRCCALGPAAPAHTTVAKTFNDLTRLLVERSLFFWRGSRRWYNAPMTTAYLADLLNRGVGLRPHEAVAIVQQLINTPVFAFKWPWLETSPGPPSVDNVQLRDDGTVVCVGCHVTPAVFEIAILLQAMLAVGSRQVPGGLRYAIARGLLEVDASPFDSIGEFSRGLERFERGSRCEVVREALASSTGERVVLAFGRLLAVPAPVDRRRRSSPSTTVLARDLPANHRLYKQRPVAR
jgi:hypothetical protein